MSIATSKSAFALLVGISQFVHEAFHKRPLPVAENDVNDFKQLLCEGLGWDDKKCAVLHGMVNNRSLIEAFNSQIDVAALGVTHRSFCSFGASAQMTLPSQTPFLNTDHQFEAEHLQDQ